LSKFSKNIPPRKITNNKFPQEVTSKKFFECNPAFSFKHLVLNHSKFDVYKIDHCDKWYKFIEHLRIICNHSWKQIHQEMRGHFHWHEITWKDTSETGQDKIWNEVAAVQIKAFGDCRLIGYISPENIFEVVWIDPEHLLYDDGRH
jgi:hypothetical protein